MFDTLSDKFASDFKYIQGKSTITEDNIEETLKEVRTALLEADVNFKVVKDFVKSVKEKALGEKVIKGVNPGEQFVKIMHDELAKIMGEANEEINLNRSGIVLNVLKNVVEITPDVEFIVIVLYELTSPPEICKISNALPEAS